MNAFDSCYEFVTDGFNSLLRNAFSCNEKKRESARKRIATMCPILSEILGTYDPLRNSKLINLTGYRSQETQHTIDFKHPHFNVVSDGQCLPFFVSNSKTGKKLMIYGTNWKCRIERKSDGKLTAVLKNDNRVKDKYYVT